MKKLSALLVMLSSIMVHSALAQELSCAIPDVVLNAVAEVESGYVKGGYPYLIGINEPKDIKKAKVLFKGFGRWLEGRSLDCGSKENCIAATSVLFENGIFNVDLGRYQINHKFHHMYATAIEDYFEEGTSRKIACKVIDDCVKQYGYTWYGVSCYHSRTPSNNSKYSNRLFAAMSTLNQ